MIKLALALVVTVTPLALAQPSPDLAVLSALKQADRALDELRVLRRTAVTGQLDLVVAIGTPKRWPLGEPESAFWWYEDRKLGLFLQENNQPARVFTLAIEASAAECSARILRTTETDTVLSCDGEKSERFPNHKFVYDVRAKRLVKHFTYVPFLMYRASARASAVGFVGTDGVRRLDADFVVDRSPSFAIRGTSIETQEVGTAPYIQPPAPRPALRRFGPSGDFYVEEQAIRRAGGQLYRLPVSDFATFARARPDRVKDGYDRETIFEKAIGPRQIEGNTLWFGKTFYDGEGISGIGAVGYFDAAAPDFRLFTHPVIAECSVSAINVQRDAVWLALVGHGEYGDNGCGLVRFDRKAETFETLHTSGVGLDLAQLADRLFMATDRGISMIEGNKVSEYFVDVTTDGRLRVAASN